MSSGMEENKQAGDNVMNNLMQLNRLTYRTPASLSIASQRHYVVNFPQQRSYGDGETIVFNCNTGSQFLDARRSYLSFNVKAPDAAGQPGSTCDFGKGSAWNLFQNIRVKSRSGTEICRVQGAGFLSNIRHRWNCPRPSFGTSLVVEGYGTAINSGSGIGDGGQLGTAEGMNVVLPLHWIPCFDQKRLLPPQLMDGCIIEIELAPLGSALVADGVGTPPASYQISKLKARWDAYVISDQFARKVNDMAARDGLSLVHKEYYRTIASANASAFNYDVKKSASKALGVYVAPRLSANVNNLLADSNITELAFDLQQYQFQNSSTYYPNEPQTVGNTIQSCAEAYYYALAAWHRTDCEKNQDVSPDNFVGTTGSNEASMGIAATSFTKSQVSDLAGILINSARTLNCEVLFNNGADRRLDTWLCHARHVKVFQENAVVAD